MGFKANLGICGNWEEVTKKKVKSYGSGWWSLYFQLFINIFFLEHIGIYNQVLQENSKLEILNVKKIFFLIKFKICKRKKSLINNLKDKIRPMMPSFGIIVAK